MDSSESYKKISPTSKHQLWNPDRENNLNTPIICICLFLNQVIATRISKSILLNTAYTENSTPPIKYEKTNKISNNNRIYSLPCTLCSDEGCGKRTYIYFNRIWSTMNDSKASMNSQIEKRQTFGQLLQDCRQWNWLSEKWYTFWKGACWQNTCSNPNSTPCPIISNYNHFSCLLFLERLNFWSFYSAVCFARDAHLDLHE